MTLFVWAENLEGIVKDLENIAKHFRTRRVHVNRLDVAWVETVLNEQYMRWHPLVSAYYEPSRQNFLLLSIYFVSLTYAPFILYKWSSKVLFEHRVRGEKGYKKGVKSSWSTSPLSSILDLYDLVEPYGLFPGLKVWLDLWIDKYLYIEEIAYLFNGSMALPKLLLQLLL